MPLLNYQKQFAPLVESGEKQQTIRAWRKRLFKTGDRLYHYTGLRTKHCKKLAENVCKLAVGITITKESVEIHYYRHNDTRVNEDLDKFAIADGFQDWREMKAWFRKTHGLPFSGQLIMW